MDPNDFDWEKELSPPPLQGKGFDDQLRKRIEEQLDRKEEKRRKRFWLYPILCTCSLLAVSAGLWIAAPLTGASGELAHPEAIVSASGWEEQELPDNAIVPANENYTIKTGVLIGLRQDHTSDSSHSALPDGTYSTYRTLMVAPVQDEVQVTAEGEGILVPYGQKFWKIDALTHMTPTDTIHYLSAHPADKQAVPASFKDDPEEHLQHTETLQFAGNQYVSVSEKESIWRGNAPAEYSRVWVRKLPQMQEPPVTDFSSNKSDTGHVPLQEVYGEGVLSVLEPLSALAHSENPPSARLDGESWAITRKPGFWTAQAAQTYSHLGNRNDGYTLLDYPVPLPEIVVNHDVVSNTWGQIKSLQPDAQDVLASPLDDLLVIWTEKELVVYSPAASSRRGPLLRVELKPGEKLVSAQWATGSYVPQWVEKTRKYLEPELEL